MWIASIPFYILVAGCALMLLVLIFCFIDEMCIHPNPPEALRSIKAFIGLSAFLTVFLLLANTLYSLP